MGRCRGLGPRSTSGAAAIASAEILQVTRPAIRRSQTSPLRNAPQGLALAAACWHGIARGGEYQLAKGGLLAAASAAQAVAGSARQHRRAPSLDDRAVAALRLLGRARCVPGSPLFGFGAGPGVGELQGGSSLKAGLAQNRRS